MNASWKRFSLVMVVAILTIASFATWFTVMPVPMIPAAFFVTSAHEPAIGNPVSARLPVPVQAERNLETAEVRPISREPFRPIRPRPSRPSFAS
jgi:hypothetical protein